MAYRVQFEIEEATTTKIPGSDEDFIHGFHFMQFARAWEMDLKGEAIAKTYEATGTFKRLGEWYLDVPWSDVIEQSVYYDATGASARSNTMLSIFDSPSNPWTCGEHSRIGIDFITIAICDGRPYWEIRWRFVADMAEDGEP
eukprot:CAMPEP_0185798148 /NCGR_PEP_ID=MMETSP1174-20130828/161996_1 /TAXON_ID=35687 /ORGANISM="Dictyocha speculum, Strain CCMP1381" /LENGTH=141 /DNA_ID=CAMNT_0028493629 /DNA_START=420 /DNA_END=842 /DNA_ORIENTATION=-